VEKQNKIVANKNCREKVECASHTRGWQVPESYPGYSRQRTALKTLLKKRIRDSNLLPRNYSTENRKEQKVEKRKEK
jgi:hypothetical protein